MIGYCTMKKKIDNGAKSGEAMAIPAAPLPMGVYTSTTHLSKIAFTFMSSRDSVSSDL